MSPEGRACVDHPELPQCQPGIYRYVLDKHSNMAFVLLFVILAFPLAGIVCSKRRAHLYSAAVFAGLVLEIMGYSARFWSFGNQLQNDPFYMQIICLTMGPAFLAAAIYLSMRRIVVCFDPRHSILCPETYTRLFIPCDLVSLILQGTGGALAASAHKANDMSALNRGTNTMIAGLAFQVFTMFVFAVLGLNLLRKVLADHRRRVRDGSQLDPNIEAIQNSRSFKAFVLCIIGSTLLIFARCCYRVAELSEGWRGSLMKNQTLFTVCEGVLVFLASLLLIIAHPALTAPVVLNAGGDFGSIREKLTRFRCFGGGADENRVDEEIGLSLVPRSTVKENTATGPITVPPPPAPQHEPVSPLEGPSAQPSSPPASPSSHAVKPAAQRPQSTQDRTKIIFDKNYLRACESGDVELVKKVVALRPQELEWRDSGGNVPLQIASRNGHYDLAKFLIDKGSNIEATNLAKNTPLMDAVEKGHLRIVRILLAAGADPHLRNVAGKEALALVKDDSEDALAIRAALREAKYWTGNSADTPP